jgi:hypothetical protein
MTRQIRLRGFHVKGSKVVRDARRLDVSARIRHRSSKAVRIARPGEAMVREQLKSEPPARPRNPADREA